MNIYMYIDGSDLDTLDEEMTVALTNYVNSSKVNSSKVKPTLVNNHHPEGETISTVDLTDLELGIDLTIKNKFDLKEPLNALYKIAKTHELNFVVGIHDAKSGKKDDVCYFGHEEGKPDLYEIACYLGV